MNLDLNEIKNITSLFANAIKDRLASDGSNATHQLSSSITDIVKYDGKYITISINIEEYWKYVEYGRSSGKFPPVDKIKEWIRVKPVIPYSKGNKKLPTENQLVYLIGRKIARVGTSPQPFLAPTIKDFDLVDKIYSMVSNMVIEAANNEIEEELNS